ncbi:MAG: 30S ribosomal protein S8 [Minisyncoccia bacterium]
MDVITDLFNRIKNAQAVHKISTVVPYSKLKEVILEKMRENGFILDFKVRKIQDKKSLRIYLKYTNEGKGTISGIKRISKPGKRIYIKAKDIKTVKSGFGIAILSTSKGILTDKEAKKLKTGGELIAEIW